VTRGQLPQRAGSLGLNSGGAAAAVPPLLSTVRVVRFASLWFPGHNQCKATFTLIRVWVRVMTPGFGLRLVQASPVRVSVQGQLYKDNSTRVYRQSPVKSNRENALRKKLQYTTPSLIILLIAHLYQWIIKQWRNLWHKICIMACIILIHILRCLHRTGWIKTRPTQKLLVRVKFTGNSYSYRSCVNVNGHHWNTRKLVFTRTRIRLPVLVLVSMWMHPHTDTSTSPATRVWVLVNISLHAFRIQ